MKILNKSQLAESLGRSRGYVTAMVTGGYEMEFGTTTTLPHALAWLRANRDFRSTGFWSRRGLSGTPSNRARLTADKPCEPQHSNGR
jgi:hypothetical protein